MSGKIRLNGSTSGFSEITAPAVAGDQTFTLPAAGGEIAVVGSSIPWNRIGTNLSPTDIGDFVGIGTNNPVSTLDVNGIISSRGRYIIDTQTDVINIGGIVNSATLGISTIRFFTSNIERMRVTDNGLTFNGDTAAANALNDYEEGTWTPSATAYSGTMGVNSANYRKIGSLCFVQAYISFDSTTDSSSIVIGGLPFTGAGANNNYYVISSQTNGGLEELYLRAQGTTTSLTAVHLSSGDGDNKPSYTSLADKFIIFSGSYITT